MHEVTKILCAIQEGDPRAPEQLLPLVYDALRKLAAQKMAHEPAGQTLQPTALVHEVYLRLVGSEKGQHWNSRGHFFWCRGGSHATDSHRKCSAQAPDQAWWRSIKDRIE